MSDLDLEQLIRDPNFVEIVGKDNAKDLIIKYFNSTLWHKFSQRMLAMILCVPFVWLGAYSVLYKANPQDWVFYGFGAMATVGLGLFFPKSFTLILIPILSKFGIKADKLLEEKEPCKEQQEKRQEQPIIQNQPTQ